jgi:hypothetical protein
MTLTNKDIEDIRNITDFSEPIIIKNEISMICNEILSIRSFISYGASLFLAYENDGLPTEICDFLQRCYCYKAKYED